MAIQLNKKPLRRTHTQSSHSTSEAQKPGAETNIFASQNTTPAARNDSSIFQAQPQSSTKEQPKTQNTQPKNADTYDNTTSKEKHETNITSSTSTNPQNEEPSIFKKFFNTSPSLDEGGIDRQKFKEAIVKASHQQQTPHLGAMTAHTRTNSHKKSQTTSSDNSHTEISVDDIKRAAAIAGVATALSVTRKNALKRGVRRVAQTAQNQDVVGDFVNQTFDKAVSNLESKVRAKGGQILSDTVDNVQNKYAVVDKKAKVKSRAIDIKLRNSKVGKAFHGLENAERQFSKFKHDLSTDLKNEVRTSAPAKAARYAKGKFTAGQEWLKNSKLANLVNNNRVTQWAYSKAAQVKSGIKTKIKSKFTKTIINPETGESVTALKGKWGQRATALVQNRTAQTLTKWGGRAATVVAVAEGLYSTGEEVENTIRKNGGIYKKDGTVNGKAAKEGTKAFIEKGGEKSGGIVGGIVGAKIGAAVGSAFVPPLGTLVGGVVGGAIGYVAGSKVGKELGKLAKNAAIAIAHTPVGQKAIKTAKAIANSPAGKAVINGAKKAWNGVKSVVNGGKNLCKKAWNGVKSGVKAVGRTYVKGVKTVARIATAPARMAFKAGKTVVRAIANTKVGKAIANSRVGKAVSTTVHNVANKAKNIGNKIANFFGF